MPPEPDPAVQPDRVPESVSPTWSSRWWPSSRVFLMQLSLPSAQCRVTPGYKLYVGARSRRVSGMISGCQCHQYILDTVGLNGAGSSHRRHEERSHHCGHGEVDMHVWRAVSCLVISQQRMLSTTCTLVLLHGRYNVGARALPQGMIRCARIPCALSCHQYQLTEARQQWTMGLCSVCATKRARNQARTGVIASIRESGVRRKCARQFNTDKTELLWRQDDQISPL